MSRHKAAHVAEITSPCRGVATYRTENGAWVFHAAIEADPLKNEQWIDMVASAYAGGRNSVEFLQEFRADDEAKSGEALYWAFSRDRNVLPWSALPTGRIPAEWPIFLGGDFGQRVPTAIIFLAQEPSTRRIFVFDSIYRPKGIDDAVKELVYEKMSAHLGIPMEDLVLRGLYNYLERAVADPTAAPYIDFYRMEPWPVNFIIKAGPKTPSRHRPGESKVNKALWPSFVHCGYRHYAPGTEEPPETVPCPRCKVECLVAPVLYIMEDAAPELIQEYESLVDKEPANEGLETLEVKVKAPDHACLVAGTMVSTPAGEIPIEKILAGDEVMTHLGYRKVTRSWCDGENADTFRVVAPNGRELIGTGNHPIWTINRGWVYLEDIKHFDKPSMLPPFYLDLPEWSGPLKDQRQAVFNLTVEEAHSFFANGVLVSNSDAARYVLFDMEWEPTGQASEEEEAQARLRKLRDKPKEDRTFGDRIELIMAGAQEAQTRAFDAKKRPRGLVASKYNRGRVVYSSQRFGA